MRGQRMADARARAGAISSTTLLAPDDEASLLGFNHETRMFGAVDDASAPACARSSTRSARPAAPRCTTPSTRRCRCSNRASIRARRMLLVSDGADTASDMTPTALKQKLVRSDVFLYAIGIDSIDARNSTRINPFTLQRADQPGRRLHRDHQQHRRARPRHRADRRGAESPVHDRLHADHARRRQVPYGPRQGDERHATKSAPAAASCGSVRARETQIRSSPAPLTGSRGTFAAIRECRELSCSSSWPSVDTSC